ncbi:MAG: hypothetical protein DWQ04_35250 [Chloroflexi bacterium]|nr:MAG: hypothetical protein DWQ04_35250 [Chloroflexota bacterium]
MNNSQKLEQEKSVLRWGGLSGMLGGILLIAVMVFVSIFIPPDPADLAGWVKMFPDIKVIRLVENVTYLTALILEVPLFLALYHGLRKTSLAPALFGSVLGILGLVAMMVSSNPHVAHTSLADLYHAPGATPADQAAIALMWQAIWGMINMMLYVGFFIVPIGLIILGVGMLGTPSFGKGFGRASLVLGVVGLVAAVLQMADPPSFVGVGSYFAGIIFYLVLGWKVYSLSRA